jgi:hypothetical protein
MQTDAARGVEDEDAVQKVKGQLFEQLRRVGVSAHLVRDQQERRKATTLKRPPALLPSRVRRAGT